MIDAEKHLELLSTLIADGFFLLADDGETLAAIEWLMAEMQRLTTENTETLFEIRRLKNKCNSLWKAINQSTPEHYPSKDDLTWEVIE
jgi:hypothetical protein